MSKLRIFYVASEINPFLQTSEVANFLRSLPQAMQERGTEKQGAYPKADKWFSGGSLHSLKVRKGLSFS